MPRFLAVYTMKPEDLARFRSLPKAEQDAVDAAGLPQWLEWERRNAASFPDRGGMVGKTRRVSRNGVADATNAFCGYIVVEADTIATPPACSRTIRISRSFRATAWTSCPSSPNPRRREFPLTAHGSAMSQSVRFLTH